MECVVLCTFSFHSGHYLVKNSICNAQRCLNIKLVYCLEYSQFKVMVLKMTLRDAVSGPED